jgi:hypothetical protein
MKLIAIDLGKFIGVFNGEDAHTEFLGDPPKGWGADEFRPRRFGNAMRFLDRYFLQEGPDVVAYEKPFNRGLGATRAGWGYAGIIEALADQYQAAILDPSNQKIRQWATGTGKKQGSKNPMIERAKELTGLDLDEHSADAVCMWHYVKATMEIG